jgi:hypothetical protein
MSKKGYRINWGGGASREGEFICISRKNRRWRIDMKEKKKKSKKRMYSRKRKN